MKLSHLLLLLSLGLSLHQPSWCVTLGCTQLQFILLLLQFRSSSSCSQLGCKPKQFECNFDILIWLRTITRLLASSCNDPINVVTSSIKINGFVKNFRKFSAHVRSVEVQACGTPLAYKFCLGQLGVDFFWSNFDL